MHLKVCPPLETGFAPLCVALRDYAAEVWQKGGQRVSVSVVRDAERVMTYTFDVLPDGVDDARSLRLAERIAKTLLWVYGGAKLVVSGSRAVYEHIRSAYCPGGARAFDVDFMSTVFEKPFEVCWADEPLPTRWEARPVGRHLDGCRIGFDAGGSDRKVSAVIDGETVYSEELLCHPKLSAYPA